MIHMEDIVPAAPSPDRDAVAQAAEDLYDRGYYCSEAIVAVASAAMGVSASTEAMRIATGFGAGMGHAGATCGALSGAVMAASMLLGREDEAGAYLPATSAARHLHRRFLDVFGSASCADLIEPFGGMAGIGRHEYCRAITGRCATWVLDVFESHMDEG